MKLIPSSNQFLSQKRSQKSKERIAYNEFINDPWKYMKILKIKNLYHPYPSIYYSEDGHSCRSLSEVIVDNFLYRNGIIHDNEGLIDKEYEFKYDFFVPSIHDLKNNSLNSNKYSLQNSNKKNHLKIIRNSKGSYHNKGYYIEVFGGMGKKYIAIKEEKTKLYKTLGLKMIILIPDDLQSPSSLKRKLMPIFKEYRDIISKDGKFLENSIDISHITQNSIDKLSPFNRNRIKEYILNSEQRDIDLEQNFQILPINIQTIGKFDSKLPHGAYLSVCIWPSDSNSNSLVYCNSLLKRRYINLKNNQYRVEMSGNLIHGMILKGRLNAQSQLKSPYKSKFYIVDSNITKPQKGYLGKYLREIKYNEAQLRLKKYWNFKNEHDLTNYIRENQK